MLIYGPPPYLKDHPVQQKVAGPREKPTQALPVPATLPEEAISPEKDVTKNRFMLMMA